MGEDRSLLGKKCQFFYFIQNMDFYLRTHFHSEGAGRSMEEWLGGTQGSMPKLWRGGSCQQSLVLIWKRLEASFIFHPWFDRNVFSCFQLTKSGSTLQAPSLTDFGVFVQVFAFVKSDQSNNSTHRADCHVCESLLEFRTEVEVINLLMPKLLFCFLFKELNM